MRLRGPPTWLLVVGVSLGTTAAGAEPPAEPEAAAESSRDQILERADIRSRGRFHGEVRLVARGEARVVQTLLYSKILRKVIARIREKESESWPVTRAGHEDSRTYVAALESAAQEVGQAGSAKGGDRRRKLLIEFWASRSEAGVAFREPRVEKVDDELTITDTREMNALPLSREYVTRSMLLIASEHFPMAEAELGALLLPGD
jgi:hypothetical protein